MIQKHREYEVIGKQIRENDRETESGRYVMSYNWHRRMRKDYKKCIESERKEVKKTIVR